MTKKLTDLESQAQQSSAKEWKGNWINNSDVGYDSEWDDILYLNKLQGQTNQSKKTKINMKLFYYNNK